MDVIRLNVLVVLTPEAPIKIELCLIAAVKY